jgi:tRNA-splicing ligase RtcB
MSSSTSDVATGVSLVRETPYRCRVERRGAMRVPGIVFATTAQLPDEPNDRSLVQVANVATLPGIVEASYAMPDVHWGYGFPIGGVAGTDIDAGGVVSPGGVGFDISCGVRLLVSELDHNALDGRLDALMDALDRRIPRGLGRGAIWEPSPDEFHEVLRGGARYAVRRGHGVEADLEYCEDGGALRGATCEHVSVRALARGAHQVGSLGAGNHFLEVQRVDKLFDTGRAAAFGLEVGRTCVMIHSGSRGFGHQVCQDHVAVMQPAMRRFGIEVPDRQLACAPVASPEGRAYLGAMAAAANFGRANRQLLTEGARDAFEETLGTRVLRLLYDVSHNLAKLERHDVDGRPRDLCVHRKGATRALPPGHPDLPTNLRDAGQPVLVPGSMGTASYVCVGVEGSGAFHSSCHGAGRTMSRHAARRRVRGEQLRDELEARGVHVRAGSWRGFAEEAPFSYKDIDGVVETCEHAGLARRVARLVPVGIVKG